VLFCFGCGGSCWIVAAAGSGARIPERYDGHRFLARFALWSLLAFAFVYVVWLCGGSILSAVILGFTASGLFALVQAPAAVRLIVPGMLGFTAIYTAVSWFVLGVFPGAAGFWLDSAVCGRRVFGLPVEEILWAASFGATWPVVFAYCLGEVDRGDRREINSAARRSSESFPGSSR
jgi:hypothetical protein